MTDHGWSLGESQFFELRDTAGSGRGIFARCDLEAGTHILTTSHELSPIAHVIQRPYRREVCAQCFAYDRGTDWKVRLPLTALSFCSQQCLEDWKLVHNIVHIEALQVAEASVQRHRRRDEDKMEIDSDEMTWERATEIGQAIITARSLANSSKTDRRLLSKYSFVPTDPDIVYFLLSGCFMATPATNDKLDSLLTLASNHSVYRAASLEAHTDAYLHLLTMLPSSLLHDLRADVCHELVSRAAHNAFSIRPSSDGEHSGEFLGYGVWPEASFFNHSCRPNVFKGRKGRSWLFHVSRDVGAGEELCITYLGGDEKDLDVKGRRKRLFDEWGFACLCGGCVEEAEVAE